MPKGLFFFIAIIGVIVVGGLLYYLVQSPESTSTEQQVVVYVAHDQDYSEPILEEFEKETGIKVLPLYDTEVSKTVGLVNKLIAEKNNPQADVFWNNEMVRSVQLKNEGIFEKYVSPNSNDIPSDFKDPQGYWTGFAVRARVIIYNTSLVADEEAPTSFYDFQDSKWEGKACIANPLFGTTGSHVAALFALEGDEEAKEFFTALKENNIQIVASNSMVRDQVVAGDCLIGITDTDDANDAIIEGKPVKMIFPDQKENEIGTLIIPNTVGLINRAPHKENGKKLIDYLLSKKVEKKLSETKAIQMPTRPDVETPKNVPVLGELKRMNVTPQQIHDKLGASTDFVQNVFIK